VCHQYEDIRSGEEAELKCLCSELVEPNVGIVFIDNSSHNNTRKILSDVGAATAHTNSLLCKNFRVAVAAEIDTTGGDPSLSSMSISAGFARGDPSDDHQTKGRTRLALPSARRGNWRVKCSNLQLHAASNGVNL
jgi:hypothetical protein